MNRPGLLKCQGFEYFGFISRNHRKLDKLTVRHFTTENDIELDDLNSITFCHKTFDISTIPRFSRSNAHAINFNMENEYYMYICHVGHVGHMTV